MKKKDNVLVSVIVNCHNAEEYLEECIKSIINQTYENWELIFLDNFSSDNSKFVLDKFQDKRIKYFKSNNLLNLYEARNLAIDKSRGEYVSFLDTDDFWEKDKIHKQIEFLEKHESYQIVFSNYYVFKERKKNKTIRHKINLPSGKITQKLLDFYSIGILTILLKKSIFAEHKFNRNYNIIGDFDFFIRLSQKFKIASIQEPLASYRVHSLNYSSKNIKMHIRELQNWIKTNEENFKKNGYSLNKQKFYLFKIKLKYLLNSIFYH